MMDLTLDTIRESDRQFLQGIEKKLECNPEALLAVRALAVPVRLDPEVAFTVLKSPLVNTNGNSEAILGEILQMPFVHRFPDGTFKYAQDARVYFDARLQQEQPGGNGNGLYTALNRLLADFYQERRKKLNGGAPPESREARQLTLSESLHRLASDEPERGVEDLGEFSAQAMGLTARADTYAAMNIFQVRAPIIGPDRLEPLFVQAKYFYLAQDYKTAAPLLEQVCAFPPETFNTHTRRFIFALASHFLGYIYVKRGGKWIKPAIDWLQKSVAMGRGFAKPMHIAMALNTLGTAFLALRPAEPVKAVKALEEAVEIDPDDASRAMSLNTLGAAYLALRPAEPERAVTVLEEAVEIDLYSDSRAMSLNTLGTAYLALRPTQAAKAVTALEEAVEIDPDAASRAMSLNTLGTAYLALRPAEPVKAVKALEESVRLAADDTEQKASSLNTLGTAYLALRPAQAAKAVTALEEAVEIDPDAASRAMSLNTLGTAYLALRPAQPEKAVKALEESVRLTDDSANRAIRLNTLGMAYLALRPAEPVKAVKALEESVKLAADTAQKAMSLNTLGNVYLKSGDSETAIAKLQESLKLLKDSYDTRTKATAHYLLGRSYENRGQRHEAIAAYRAAEALDRSRGKTQSAERMAQNAARLEEELKKKG